MNFVSFEFLLFLATTWVGFAFLPAKSRMLLILIASYVFYAFWSLPFIAIILLTTSIDYVASKYLERSNDQAKRKLVLATAVALNLLILGIFKYADFALSTIHPLAVKLGAQSYIPEAANIILPLGISFYTFEAISYLVDVYRGAKAAPNWLKYNFYIMYFPHLISGPIVRFGELFCQFDKGLALPNASRFARGFELILLGYLFKTVFADGAARICDPMFANPHSISVLDTYVGAIAFTCRIYFDFLGYTHIASGVSLLFNIELPLNFNHPFCASNISNFWDRWHISLSRWIKDYLFVPLGGSRQSLFRVLFTLMLVMAISGAWHGAGWTYIVWGIYHGLLLAFYFMYRRTVAWVALRVPRVKEVVENSLAYRIFSIGITDLAVVVGFVIFGAPNLRTASILLKNMMKVDTLAGSIASMLSSGQFAVTATLLVLAATLISGPLLVNLYRKHFRPLPLSLKAHAATYIALLCWICSAEGYKPFIYFKF